VTSTNADSKTTVLAQDIPVLDKARQIEKTLLMSELFVLGYLEGLKNNPKLSEILKGNYEACIKRKGKIQLGYSFSSAIVEVLSQKVISDGYLKSNNNALVRSNEYIINNINTLGKEYRSSNTNLNASEYFLLQASERLEFTETEIYSIQEFLSWYRTADFFKVHNHRRLDYEKMRNNLMKVMQACYESNNQ
jgi:hypothetical protein